MLRAAAGLLLLLASQGGEQLEVDLEQETYDEVIDPEGESPPVEMEPEPAAPADERADQANQSFDALMEKNALPSPRAEPATMVPLVAAPEPEEARIPLREFRALRDEIRRAQEQQPSAPPVVLGASDYRGRALSGALSLSMSLEVTLGAPGRWKTVPLIGQDVVLVSAKRDGRAIPTSKEGGYLVWITADTGEVRIELEVLIPARGPRGSIEFDFFAPRTPVTSFRCQFPVAGLEPRIDGAVHSELTQAGGGTLLAATLRPTARIHLVGFRDLGAAASAKAKVYAESLNLLSIDESALELFSVVRYTILYGATKDFALRIPAGFSVVSADGEGAFRFTLDRGEGETTLRGETAFPISNHYELSLRLRRDLSKANTEERFDAPLPRTIGVEREQGWLGIEVPGKLRLDEEAREEMLAIDLRQLPPEMVENAVSPLLKAYRYHGAEARVRLVAQRLPEKDPASASIDRVRAHSVVSPEGSILTDLKITLRNRLRPALALELPPGASVRSTLIDGDPVKPSRGDDGHLILPLKRSRGGERLVPFTLEIVLEVKQSPLGWFGVAGLTLPAIDLPISSLVWSVELPARNTYGHLEGEVGGQTFAGQGSWSPPPQRGVGDGGGSAGRAMTGESAHASADTGAMPVRISLPEGGVRLEHARYWIEASRSVRVWTPYLRSWLAAPIGWLLFALLAGAAFAANRASATLRLRAMSGAGALVIAWPLVMLTSVAPLILGALLGVIAARWSAVRGTAEAVRSWIARLPAEWRARPRPDKRTIPRLLWKLTLGFWSSVAVLLIVFALARLALLLGRPLGG